MVEEGRRRANVVLGHCCVYGFVGVHVCVCVHMHMGTLFIQVCKEKVICLNSDRAVGISRSFLSHPSIGAIMPELW